ncbi:MAG: choice-of-anchor D domain-containing protein [Bacteroidetes bacterium]|nr:MAG: choice-of-anchor D domain-containing protein [Bacteroidota bacterium]
MRPLAAILFLLSAAFAQNVTITPLGPSGGIITLLKASADDAAVLAVVAEGPMVRSVDGGFTWSTVASFLPTGAGNQRPEIADIAFHPYSSDTVLAATTAGLYRSSDRGATWTFISGGPTPRYSVRYAPANPAIVIGSDGAGVLRSTDGGWSWSPLKDNTFFGNRPVRRVAVHPADAEPFSMRIAATTTFDDTTGIFLTTNGGAAWQPMVTGLPKGAARRIYAAEIDSTGLGKTHFRVVIGTADGVYGMQTDQYQGAWQAVKNNALPFKGTVTGGAFIYDSYDQLTQQHKFSFFLSSNGSEYDGPPAAYTPAHGLFRIDSRYSTIITVGALQPPVVRVFDGLCDIVSIASPVSANKQKLYLGTSDGIFVSMDGGTTWERRNTGIKHAVVRNVVSVEGPGGSGTLYAAVYGGGVKRSTDDGATWSTAGTGINNPYVTAVAADRRRGILYAGSVFTLQQSIDNGKTWTVLFTADSTMVVTPERFTTRENESTIRISPVDPNLLLYRTSAYGLRLSTNSGVSWHRLTMPPALDTIHTPENIAFDPVEANTIYLAGGRIYRSADLGQHWSDISGNIPVSVFVPELGRESGLEMVSPTVNPSDPSEIFVASTLSERDGGPYLLYRTSDAGQSWQSMDTAVRVYDVEFDRYDAKRLVASGPSGVFRSVNGGSSWSSMMTQTQRPSFYLTDAHVSDQDRYYFGSDQGVVRGVIDEPPFLTVDTAVVDFGLVMAGGMEEYRLVTLKNSSGLRNVRVRFAGLSDTAAFRYEGIPEYDIPAGQSAAFTVRFAPLTGGARTALLRFVTTDPRIDTLRIVLKGGAFSEPLFSFLSADAGAVLVGRDTVLTLQLNNEFGGSAVSLQFLGSTDSSSFRYLGPASLVVDTGATAALQFRFAPRTAGVKRTSFGFSTSDPRFPSVQLRMTGTGVTRNFVSRRILFDTSVGLPASNGASMKENYSFLLRALDRADIAADLAADRPSTAYSAVMYVQPDGPPPPEVIDSLRRYVLNGGTVVAVGDHGFGAGLPFNTFLHDSVWAAAGLRTGLRFEPDQLVDASTNSTTHGGTLTAYPAVRSALTNNVDSIALLTASSITVDSAVANAAALFVARSPMLYSIREGDTSYTAVPSAAVAAVSRLGKGKVIALSDRHLWENGMFLDSMVQYGLFSARNLQFALNVFGTVDNYTAVLPNPTPQEAYQLISIPFHFSDSSVLALFKDLGRPNDLVWRMFGRWTDAAGYEEFPDQFKSVRRGEAYWLITKQRTGISFGTTEVQGSEADFELTLQPGFTMLGNPFPYAVSWAESFREDTSVSAVLWRYDGRWDTTTQVMRPFEGYFVRNRSQVKKTVRISSVPVDLSLSVPKFSSFQDVAAPDEWVLRIAAECGDASDRVNFAGRRHGAHINDDPFDLDDPPPAPGKSVSVTFRNGTRRLASDMRPVSADGGVWEFEVGTGAPGAVVRLLLERSGVLPPGHSMVLLDIEKERAYAVTGTKEVTIPFGRNEIRRGFRLLTGNERFLAEHSGGIPLTPVEYALHQNYPNPFNPVTNITYGLARSGEVRLEVFNLLGQKVRTLYRGFQPAGTFTAVWDGRNDENSPVSSGVYYYRLQSREYSAMRKMTLIK